MNHDLQNVLVEVVQAINDGSGPLADRLLAEYVRQQMMFAVVSATVMAFALAGWRYWGGVKRNAGLRLAEGKFAFAAQVERRENRYREFIAKAKPEDRLKATSEFNASDPEIDKDSFLRSPDYRLWDTVDGEATVWWAISMVAGLVSGIITLCSAGRATAPVLSLIEKLVQ